MEVNKALETRHIWKMQNDPLQRSCIIDQEGECENCKIPSCVLFTRQPIPNSPYSRDFYGTHLCLPCIEAMFKEMKPIPKEVHTVLLKKKQNEIRSKIKDINDEKEKFEEIENRIKNRIAELEK
jgi:hypothetical protein